MTKVIWPTPTRSRRGTCHHIYCRLVFSVHYGITRGNAGHKCVHRAHALVYRVLLVRRVLVNGSAESSCVAYARDSAEYSSCGVCTR